METFLTCRKLAEFLHEKNFLDKTAADMLEEVSLKCVKNSLVNALIPELQLFIAELPNILKLNYPVVEELFKSALTMIPKLQFLFQNSIDTSEKLHRWRDICELDYMLELLKTFESDRKK